MAIVISLYGYTSPLLAHKKSLLNPGGRAFDPFNIKGRVVVSMGAISAPTGRGSNEKKESTVVFRALHLCHITDSPKYQRSDVYRTRGICSFKSTNFTPAVTTHWGFKAANVYTHTQTHRVGRRKLLERERERERERKRRETDARCGIIWAERLQPRWMLCTQRQKTDWDLESIQTATFSTTSAPGYGKLIWWVSLSVWQ